MDLSMAMTLTLPPRSGGYVAPPDPQGAVAATLPVAPVARWHAGVSGVTEGGGRVLAATGLVGPGVTAGAEGAGPFARTDALGRKFWRFSGSEYLDVGAGLTFSNRAMAVFAVLRSGSGTTVMGIGNRTGYGAGSTATVNSGGAALDVSVAGSTAPFPRVFSRAASGDATNRQNVVAGQQVQLMGGVARTTAAGGNRIYLNTQAANVAQSSIAASGIVGAEIGRYPFAPGTIGAWSGMDLYELVVYDRVLSNAESDAVVAALVAHWAIPAITGQLVLEGDSISAGVNLQFGENSGYALCHPGAGLIPAHYRVFTTAVSGSTITQMLTRRDAANGWPTVLLAGQNVMAFEIGRNDLSGVTAAQHVANIAAYLNTATTGVLQRGWTVRALANIATGGSLASAIVAVRAGLRDPAFLNDTQSAAGQAHAGRVSVIGTDLIQKAPSGTLFLDVADSTDVLYYQGDNTHLTATGTALRASGGDTPQYGIAQGLI